MRHELPEVRQAAAPVGRQQRADAVAVVALTHAGDGRVDRDDEHRVAGRTRARHARFRDRAAAGHVELIPERAAGLLADFLEPVPENVDRMNPVPAALAARAATASPRG